MSTHFYIIPGWEDTGNEASYQMIRQCAEEKGYKVTVVSINWKKPLSEQTFVPEKDSVIFGFSFGALLAHIISHHHECEHVILGSMTPYYSFINPEIKQALIDLAGESFVYDIVSHLNLSGADALTIISNRNKHKAQKQTSIYGDKEGDIEVASADVVVPNTDHEISPLYVEKVVGLL